MNKLFHLLALAALASPSVAERICPESDPYGPCRQTREMRDGSTEIHLEGKPYDSDSTWVIRGDKMHIKGKPYDLKNTYNIKKQRDGTTKITPALNPYDLKNTWIRDGDRVYRPLTPYDRKNSFRVRD